MASKNYNEDNKYTTGRLLGRGKGVNNMLRKSYQNKWGNDNTILTVNNPGDLNSSWSIYEKVLKQPKQTAKHSPGKTEWKTTR